MKKIISVVITVSMVLTLFSGTVFADPGNGNGNGNGKGKQFKDMKNHWGTESVTRIQSYGLITGYADGSFQPDKPITQAELAVIIDRLTQLKQSLQDDQTTVEDDDDEDLSDVPDWAKDSVKKGVEKKYLNLKRFHSHVQCDRLMACVAIAKALELEPVKVTEKNVFTDSGLMSEEDYGYVLALYKAGYIKGYPNGNFNPNAFISRAQIAIIIDKLLNGGGVVVSDDKEKPTWPAGSAATASSITANSTVLTWSAASDNVKVTGYKISYTVNGTAKVKYASEKTVSITGLLPDKEYTFTVEARDAAGNWSSGGPSVIITTPDTVVSAKPTWLAGSVVTASSITENSVVLDWTAAEDDVKVVGYKVSYTLSGTAKVKYTTDRTTVITGLAADKEYTFRVEAKDADGNWSNNGPAVTINTLTSTKDITNPVWADGAALTISSSTSGAVTLNWPDAEDNVGVAGYKVYQDGILIKTLGVDANDLVISGLKTNKEYTFKVRAFDAAGNLSSVLSKTIIAE